jgi:hypothetical protein
MLTNPIDPSELKGDFVSLVMAPLSSVRNYHELLWAKNPKKHDIGGIWQSIKKYGFCDPVKWDSNINGGKGGIVYGNGRFETLVSMLVEAAANGEEPPRGIGIDKAGEWYIPIAIGCDQESESMAIALGIDHNNLTLGGDFGLSEMTKLWDEESYIGLLKESAENGIMPITVDEGDLASLLLGLAGDDGGRGDEDEEKDNEVDVDGIELDHQCPKCGFQFDEK